MKTLAVPAGHLTGAEEFAIQYEPAGQASGVVKPSGQYEPAGQPTSFAGSGQYTPAHHQQSKLSIRCCDWMAGYGCLLGISPRQHSRPCTVNHQSTAPLSKAQHSMIQQDTALHPTYQLGSTGPCGKHAALLVLDIHIQQSMSAWQCCHWDSIHQAGRLSSE